MEMGFFDHLEELRWHLARSVAVLSIMGVVLFAYRQEVIGTVFMAPFKYDFITYRIICENFTDAFCPPQEGDATMFTPGEDSLYIEGLMEVQLLDSLPVKVGGKDSIRYGNGRPMRLKVSARDFHSAGALSGLKIKNADGTMVQLQATSPYEQFLKAMIYALFGAVIIGFPYLAWEGWRFIRPALSDKEVRNVRGNVAVISLLFFTGVVFCYYILLPISIQFLSSFVLFEEAQNIWRIGDVINFEMLLLFGTGLLFQLPMVVYYLSRIGMVTPAWLRKYRRHSIVVLLILAGVVTPPDPFSQILVFVPLMVLYEASILISSRVEKGKQRAEKSTQTPQA